ncbi:MAG TPA: hypothetical protein VMF07_01585, partial [Solirubrobacteraceae bacterium]|nr:hypothetical protein [Solirubrobacteraceae bacterium]
MLVNGRRRRGVVLLVAVMCACLPAALSPGAGARAVSARAASCGSDSSSFSLVSSGSRLVSEIDLPVCVTGGVTVTFAGDPAAGCAVGGLCGYSGTETFAPDSRDSGDLNITTVEQHGQRSTSATLSIGGPGSPVTSAVQRTLSTGSGTQTTSCSDDVGTSQDFGGAFYNLPVTGGQVAIDLSHTTTPPLGSRCAGPLEVDVASAMPTRTVALRTLEQGETAIDLSGGGQFTAHGLSGTVSSTLVLTLGRPQRERQTPVPTSAGHTHLTHSATVAYRVTHVAGSAVATVQSST